MSIRVGMRAMARPAMGPVALPWHAGWNFRKSHEIVGTSSGAQSEYQVQVNVHREEGVDADKDVYVGEKCLADYADIRFTAEDGETLLKHCLRIIAAGYGSDFLTGGTASASSEWPGDGYVAAYAFDNNEATRWSSNAVAKPHWVKYDLGVGVTKTARKLRLKPFGTQVANFKLQGSNNDSDWDDIISKTCNGSSNWQEWTFANATAYRYYRILVTSGDAALQSSIWEIELMEALADYALCWVKMPSTPEDLDIVLIYVYYGNTEAETTSSRRDTMWLYADFEDDLEDFNGPLCNGFSAARVDEATQGWCAYTSEDDGGGTHTCREPGDLAGSIHQIIAKASGEGFAILVERWRAKSTTTAGWVTNAQVTLADFNGDPFLWRYAYSEGGMLDTGWTTETIWRTVTTEIEGYTSLYLTFGFGDSWVADYSQMNWFDLISIRKYVSPEPGHGDWGAEETI